MTPLPMYLTGSHCCVADPKEEALLCGPVQDVSFSKKKAVLGSMSLSLDLNSLETKFTVTRFWVQNVRIGFLTILFDL